MNIFMSDRKTNYITGMFPCGPSSAPSHWLCSEERRREKDKSPCTMGEIDVISAALPFYSVVRLKV